MQKYIKKYLDHWGFVNMSIPCEVCNKKAVDIHHTLGRGKLLNEPRFLVALCRECHSNQSILNALKIGFTRYKNALDSKNENYIIET